MFYIQCQFTGDTLSVSYNYGFFLIFNRNNFISVICSTTRYNEHYYTYVKTMLRILLHTSVIKYIRNTFKITFCLYLNFNSFE